MTEKDSHSSELDGLDPIDLFASVLSSSTPSNSSPMILRVSAQGEIRHINTAFASYLGSTVEELIGQPVEVARRLCGRQIAACMDPQTASLVAAGKITDSTGRVFEPHVSLDAGVIDVILTEVTPGTLNQESLHLLTGLAPAEMHEDELRAFRTLESGDLSILALRIHNLDGIGRTQSRHDLRILLDALEETFAQATVAYGGTVSGAGIGCVLGIFGSPRRFPDHAVRAVAGADELRGNLRRMAEAFAEDGKSFPRIGIGIWTGEALSGAMGGQRLGGFSAIGRPVQAALELSSLGENEVLVGEPTLAEIIAEPPHGWVFQSFQTEAEPELKYLNWNSATILPLPVELSRLRCDMVPADSPDGQAYFGFEYLWNLQAAGAPEASPVVRLLDGNSSAALSLRETSPEKPGHTLGRYKLTEVLGAGGMGKVWLAKDRFGHPVAIKVLHTHGTPDASALQRFRREGEAMAKLRHRWICRIYEMNEVDGVSFIAMEYVNGISLSDLLSSLSQSTTRKRGTKTSPSELTDLIRSARHRQSPQGEPAPAADEGTPLPAVISRSPLPVEQALTLFFKIGEAMQFAHEHGVLHRDLKPANILLREDGEPLIADFGLAKLADSEDQASLSLTESVVGTIQNMAPEQADSSKYVDERADIYSLGTILYQMLTGRPHFTPTGNILVDGPKLQEHQPIRPRVQNPAIDADLETIVLKCLRPDPRRRYRSVRALLTDLDHYRRGEPISARPVTVTEVLWKQVLRHKTVSALSAGFLIVLGVGTIVAFVQITHRAQAAQAAAAEAEAQRKEADTQRQLAVRNKKEAEEKQALAEQREKEAQTALAEARKAKEETEQQASLREQAAAEAAGSKLLLEEVKAGLAAPPSTPIRAKYLPADVTTAEVDAGLERALFSLESQVSGAPGYDFYEKLRGVLDNLTRYILHDPIQGLPILLLWKVTIFDEEGARSVADAMDRQGIAYSGLGEATGTVGGMMQTLNDWASQGVHRAGQFQRIQQSAARLFPSSEEDPSAKVGKIIAGKLKASNAFVALALGAWNPEAIVEYAATDTEVVARGSGVKVLEPLLSASGSIKLLDINFSAVEKFPKIGKPIEKITARNSSLGSFDSEGEQYIGAAATLKELDLTGSRLKSVVFLRRLPFLKSLFLARTSVPDGSALWQTTETMEVPKHLDRLEELDLSEIPISTFVGIKHLKSLRHLRFSPELLRDRDSIQELRGMNLGTISTPKDPLEQSAIGFWARWESGAYDP